MKTFKKIRIIIYICLFIALLLLKYTSFIDSTCYIKEATGILCPSCGITRASKALLDLNFGLAINFNAYYTLVLFPIFLILMIDDITCFILKKNSLVDVIFGYGGGLKYNG